MSLTDVTGEISINDILDLSASYMYKFLKLETGVNKLLYNSYFTIRATHYPVSGIISMAPRNYYIILEFNI